MGFKACVFSPGPKYRLQKFWPFCACMSIVTVFSFILILITITTAKAKMFNSLKTDGNPGDIDLAF